MNLTNLGLTRSNKQVILDMINRTNNTNILLVQIKSFSIPTIISGDLFSLNITDIQNNVINIQYEKLNLNTLFNLTNIVYTEQQDTVHQILTNINKSYSTNFTAGDLEDDTLEKLMLGDGIVSAEQTISAKSDSLLYTGSGVIKMMNTKYNLSDVITNNIIFTYSRPHIGLLGVANE